ncbi:unnamed protein product [Porites evermanni]|uniref:Phosphatidylserine synthase n=1 Tax=Porites evermanni TaxID=104178 RepID=A0ABN8M406_9CNID|nr:unnamed protein product [Porites evermanni]
MLNNLLNNNTKNNAERPAECWHGMTIVFGTQFLSKWLEEILASEQTHSHQMGKPNNQDKTTRRNDQAHDQDFVRANGNAGEKDNRPFSINCEWDIKQTQQFSDDGTNTYFWGLIACIAVFLLFGVTQIRDGPFKRPHPAFWRLILCLSVIYELALIFLLFQTTDDARQLLKYLDEDLGKSLPEQSYGEDCRLYTPEDPRGPFHNFLEKCDVFLPAHFFGWWAKALILRDYWLLTVISVLFEVLEYSLEHQLPNFSECWWDHVYHYNCHHYHHYCHYYRLFFCVQPYHWRGLWNIPTYSGKFKRVAEQFTPYSWTSYNWKATTSLTRWLAVCGITALFLTAELNLFYLKFILWIPPPHFIMQARMALYVGMGAVSLNETYRYMDDPTCKRFGQQAWVVAAIVATEILICVKFGWDTLSIPFPFHVSAFWILFVSIWFIWTVWNFWPSIIGVFRVNHDAEDKDAGSVTQNRPKHE